MTTPTNDRQTSERERLAEWLETLAELGDMGRKPDAKDKRRIAAAQLRAYEAEIAQLRAVIARANNSLFGSFAFFLSDDRGEANEHHLSNAIERLKLDSNKQYHEIAALRAENEALRTVTPDDVERSLDEYYCDTNKYHGSAHDETKKGFRYKMLAALQSFIRSKESRRG